MRLRDNHPNEAVPRGFERLSEARDRVGTDELKRCLQMMIAIAFELNFEDGTLRPVPVEDWRSEYAAAMMSSGRKYHYFSPKSPDDPANAREVFSYGSSGRLLIIESQSPALSDQENSVSLLAVAAKTNPKRTGPRPIKLNEVCDAMRKTEKARLATMKLVEMETVFKASRETCGKARSIVLSESR